MEVVDRELGVRKHVAHRAGVAGVAGRSPRAARRPPPAARRRGTRCRAGRASRAPRRWCARHDAVNGYSFVLTNREITAGEKAAAVEHWYRHRTQVENLFGDAKRGAALRHLPS